MRWPGNKIFQVLALGSFGMGAFNTGLNIYRHIQAQLNSQNNITSIDSANNTMGSVINQNEHIINTKINNNLNPGNIITQEQLQFISSNANERFQAIRNQMYSNLHLPDYSDRLAEAVSNHNSASYKIIEIQNQINNLGPHQTISRDLLLRQIGQLQDIITASKNTIIQQLPSFIQNESTVLRSIIESQQNSFIANDNINTLLDSLNNWINNLGLYDQLAFVNITGILFIFLSMLSVLSIFYGDKLIIYLKLESRLPRISNIIKLRRKFQNYYLIISFTIMFIVMFIMLILNVLVLIYGS